MQLYKKSYRSVATVLMFFLLNGCIVVEDFAGYWDKGFIDNCVNDIVSSSMAIEGGTSKNDVSKMTMRSLHLAKHTFLMVREHPEDRGGNLIRYEISDAKYVSYRLNESKKDEFLQKYPHNPFVITAETATIPVLNKESIDLLNKIDDDDSYWIESHREPYNPSHRADCVHALN